jgi:hypothetical protein
MMSCGLADYVSIPPCAYPPIVQQWESIPLAQISSFTPDGFSNRDCFNCGQGLGSIELTAPGGYFATGGDFTTWGIAEWGTVILGVYAGLSLIGDTKRHVRKSRKAARAYRSAS